MTTKSNLMDDYQHFITTSRYSRWLEEENRRETWAETVTRYMDNVVAPHVDGATYEELYQAVLNLEVMPSMRAMMTSGKALSRDNTCGYNCSYLPVDSPRSFDEAMFTLLCGTGVGFSVERQYVSKLPVVPEAFTEASEPIVVGDSKEGWATAYKKLLESLWKGVLPTWDVSGVRPAGAKLKTFGGRASGPAPLEDLFNFTISKFKGAAGRKLNSLECHDIMCKIGQVVVVGGVRRSAMISLSNLSDNRMRYAKSGDWYLNEDQRSLSNNSVAYTEKPDMETFMREWLSLMESKSGERGLFNREASKAQVSKNGRRDPNHEWGTNPCSEIILRPFQFCNLTEIVARKEDTVESLQRKVRLAAILGTVQSNLTKFPYLRKIWKDNTEEERLLGVSITGILDNSMLSKQGKDLEDLLSSLKGLAVETNAKWAKKLGINPSASVTCVKPSGTVSQLTNSASGIHPRHSAYYIRSVRADNKDPMTDFMKSVGIPHEPCVMKPMDTSVFSFPIRSPKNAVTRDDLTALDQLNLWLTYQRFWCEHKPSITVSVREHEWLEVGAFVYEHFDEMSGVSFLPHSDHVYAQAPYQECSREDYEKAVRAMPLTIDWSKLADFESEDSTVGSSTFACSGDVCEIVDLT